jgi:hypothetical protein
MRSANSGSYPSLSPMKTGGNFVVYRGITLKFFRISTTISRIHPLEAQTSYATTSYSVNA